MTIDVIIPVYNPGTELKRLIKTIENQTCDIHKIWLMHTEDGTDLSWAKNGKILVEEIKVSKESYDHGGTRDMAMRRSKADILICMTQDAVAVNCQLVQELVKALMKQPEIAVVYARQIAGKDSDFLEKYTRNFNYPAVSKVKSKEDVEQMGIKAYFCSNVCAAYKRKIYEELGGFEKHIIFNEDMVYAATAIKAGYKVAYEASAIVKHAHNYTAMEQLKRNFDLGVSQSCYPEIFEEISSEKEGIRYMKKTTLALLKAKRPELIIRFGIHSICKYAGYRLGKMHRRLPVCCVNKLTSNPGYWKKGV